jgi:uncharacterized protein (DUF2236 family)
MARYFGAPLTREDERTLYGEILHLGRILRVPDRMFPPTVEDYWRYFDDMVENTLENHPTAHDVLRVSRTVAPPPALPPAVARAWQPFGLASGRLNHFVTVGTLPPAVRDKLGLSWTARDERRLRRLGGLVRAGVPHLPERLRYLPIAYKARRGARTQGG